MQEAIVAQARRFLEWAGQKIGLHFRERGEPNFQEREIWWVSLGENVGSEMNGKHHRFERPVVIVRKFSNDMMLVVPSTTKLKNGTWYHPYHFDGIELRAVLAQMRVISNRRLIRKMGHMDPLEFAGLKKALIDLLTV